MRRLAGARCVTVALALGIASGCALLPSNEEEQAARELLAVVARGEDLPQARIDASLRTPENMTRLPVVLEQLRGIDAFRAKRIWWGAMRNSDGRTFVSLDFEVVAKDGPSLVRVILLRGETPLLVGLHVRRLNESYPGRKEPSARTGMILIILGFSAAPILTVVALVRLFRAPRGRRKWPWALFILFGLGKLMISWNTGRIGFQPIAAQLFSASGFQTPTGDWILAASFPLGAVVYLLRSKRSPRFPDPPPDPLRAPPT